MVQRKAQYEEEGVSTQKKREDDIPTEYKYKRHDPSCTKEQQQYGIDSQESESDCWEAENGYLEAEIG